MAIAGSYDKQPGSIKPFDRPERRMLVNTALPGDSSQTRPSYVLLPHRGEYAGVHHFGRTVKVFAASQRLRQTEKQPG